MSGPPNQGLYELLGERDGVHALVERFYAVMDNLPTAATTRAIHPADLTRALVPDEAVHERLLLALAGVTEPLRNRD